MRGIINIIVGLFLLYLGLTAHPFTPSDKAIAIFGGCLLVVGFLRMTASRM